MVEDLYELTVIDERGFFSKHKNSFLKLLCFLP